MKMVTTSWSPVPVSARLRGAVCSYFDGRTDITRDDVLAVPASEWPRHPGMGPKLMAELEKALGVVFIGNKKWNVGYSKADFPSLEIQEGMFSADNAAMAAELTKATLRIQHLEGLLKEISFYANSTLPPR